MRETLKNASIATVAAAAVVALHALTADRLVQPHMPDATLTPGVALHVSVEELCVKGYAGKARHVTESEKNQVYARYGIKRHKPGQYEIDHLISLELGGSNFLDNLWPQPYQGEWNAHMKDRLENKLHVLVCAGAITLEDAQKEIAEDWVSAYEKYVSN